MIAEIISIGDELTSGQRLDTNSQWLSERLGELGIRVAFHTTVADDLEANVLVLRAAIDRADIVIASGGLGPTADDLTRDAIALVTGRELVLDVGALAHLRAIFALFGRDMPERNVVQAMFPAGSRQIPNPNGTAPGIDMEVPRDGRGPCRLIALPGVPAEMRGMWEATVSAELARLAGAVRVIRHRRIKCFGVGESHLEKMLPDMIRRGRVPSVGITVSQATITLRITAEGETPEAAMATMAPTIATIRECLGEVVFGEEDDELWDVVARLLAQSRRTLATIEWGTGGLVAHQLSELPDVAPFFLGCIVVPGVASLERLLGISASLVAKHGGASAEVVEAMAAAGRERFASDYVLAVGDQPILDRANPTPPRAWYALATSGEVIVRSAPAIGDPSIQRVRAAKQALNMLRLAMLRGS